MPAPTPPEQAQINRKATVIDQTLASQLAALEALAAGLPIPPNTEQPVPETEVDRIALIELLISKGVFTRLEWLREQANVGVFARSNGSRPVFEHQKP